MRVSDGACGDHPSDATVKREWKSLEGSWTLIKAEMLGKPLLKTDVSLPPMMIKDGKVTSKDKTASAENLFDSSTIKLDPKQRSKTITIATFRGFEVPVTLMGIYELNGDELRICLVGVEKAKAKGMENLRPKRFDSKEAILLIFKRSIK